jgi:hypothetical protein
MNASTRWGSSREASVAINRPNDANAPHTCWRSRQIHHRARFGLTTSIGGELTLHARAVDADRGRSIFSRRCTGFLGSQPPAPASGCSEGSQPTLRKHSVAPDSHSGLAGATTAARLAGRPGRALQRRRCAQTARSPGTSACCNGRDVQASSRLQLVPHFGSSEWSLCYL